MKSYRILLLLPLVLLSACAVMQQLVQAPGLSVTDMRLSQAGLFEQVLSFDLELDNPNAFALPLAGMNYTLEISGVEIGKGEQSTPITLPANGTANWPVTFKVNSLRLVQSALQGGNFKQLDYRIFGSFLLSQSESMPPIPFDRKGRIGG